MSRDPIYGSVSERGEDETQILVLLSPRLRESPAPRPQPFKDKWNLRLSLLVVPWGLKSETEWDWSDYEALTDKTNLVHSQTRTHVRTFTRIHVHTHTHTRKVSGERGSRRTSEKWGKECPCRATSG